MRGQWAQPLGALSAEQRQPLVEQPEEGGHPVCAPRFATCISFYQTPQLPGSQAQGYRGWGSSC